MKSHRHNTSWQRVGSWYHDVVGEKGHYYHENVVLPNALRLLSLKKGDSILDLGCGQGILARRLPKDVSYMGVDLAKNLLSYARSMDKNENHQYIHADIAKPLPSHLAIQPFSHVALMLALQNVEYPQNVIENAAKHLQKNGTLVIVLNHPCFRIPRQSSWGEDLANKLQYRKINRYMSPLKIPITAHPGKSHGPITWSFHRPLSHYSTMLSSNGFVIDRLEEWTSDKESTGKAAKMENRSRSEFPLFLTIRARKD